MMIRHLIVLSATLGLLAGCGIDRDSAEYDQMRYEHLQKASCEEMASLLSEPLLMEKPQDQEATIKRCNDMKSLSFQDYQRLAEHGRKTGEWDVYAVFPEKREQQ